MEKQKSLKTNMIMSMILTASGFVFPLLTYSYVARVLTPEGTGKVAFVNSILQYFSYVATLGIPSYGLRECAKVRDDKDHCSHLVQELLIINLISTAIAYIGLFFSIFNIDKLFYYKDIFLVMSICIILNAIGVEWLYQALEEYSYITLRSLLFKCISVILTFILVRNSNDILWYAFLSVFTTSANYIWNFIHVRKYISFKKVGKYNLVRHLKPIITLFSASIIITVYANFDVSMLGIISTDYEVGLYNATWKIKNIALSVSMAVTSVMIPRISYCFEHNLDKEVQNLLVKTIRCSLLLTVPIAVYILIYPTNVLKFVCGEQYVEAASALRVLMLCVFPMILSNLFGNQILIPIGREKYYTQSVFVGMWINIIINLVMIPRFGAVGAAIGTLITESWNAVWMGEKAKEYRSTIIKNVNYRIYVIALILGASLSIAFRYCVGVFSNFTQIVITASVFFGTYYINLIICKEPIMVMMLNKIMKRVKH